jgi:hypothetical protein
MVTPGSFTMVMFVFVAANSELYLSISPHLSYIRPIIILSVLPAASIASSIVTGAVPMVPISSPCSRWRLYGSRAHTGSNDGTRNAVDASMTIVYKGPTARRHRIIS